MGLSIIDRHLSSLLFAIFGSDLQALYKEILVGIIYIGLAFVALKVKRSKGILLLGITCISHAIYDVTHDHFITNSAVPSWWLEFCGSIDVLIGFYLVYLSFKLPVPGLTKLKLSE